MEREFVVTIKGEFAPSVTWRQIEQMVYGEAFLLAGAGHRPLVEAKEVIHGKPESESGSPGPESP